MKVDAVLLAGDKKGSAPIYHDNKAFLLLRGVPLVVHVLRTLLRTAHVERIFVVGLFERLTRLLRQYELEYGPDQRIVVVAQKTNLIENAMAGFVASLPQAASEMTHAQLAESQFSERYALFLPSDIPLTTPHEIDEFIVKSDMINYDYSIGVCSQEVLAAYYPKPPSVGIVMACFHLRDDAVRQNNLHLGRPFRVERMLYVEKMYRLRYQRRIANMLRMVLELMLSGRGVARSVLLFLRMQLTLFFYSHRCWNLYSLARRRISRERILTRVGQLLGTRMQMVATRFGGAALDIDNAEHLEIADRMAVNWLDYQNRILAAAQARADRACGATNR